MSELMERCERVGIDGRGSTVRDQRSRMREREVRVVGRGRGGRGEEMDVRERWRRVGGGVERRRERVWSARRELRERLTETSLEGREVGGDSGAGVVGGGRRMLEWSASVRSSGQDASSLSVPSGSGQPSK